MPYYNQQQQQPSHFPFLDELEQRVHPAIGYMCAVIFGVVMFFYGLDHPRYPLIVFIGPGIVGGLLIIALLKQTVTFLIYVGLVCAAGFGTFWLFIHTTELRQNHAAPTVHTAPARPSPRSLLDDLRKVVE